MLNTRMTIIVVLAAIAGVGGAGVWYLQSSSQVDVAIHTEPATTPAVAPKTVIEPTPNNESQQVADLIDGYDDMSRGEKQKAVLSALGKVDNLVTDRLLKTELTKLMSDAGENANKQFRGVVPNGWDTDSQ